MPVIDVVQDQTALSITLTAQFDAPPSRVWQIWADPRQLERWWGPPTWPATFVDFDFVKGGRATYYMTGPEGQKAHGWWQYTLMDEPWTLEFEDGFSDDSGEPNSELPITRAVVSLQEHAGGTRMTVVSSFESVEDLERLVAMGMVEGLREAAGQIDGVLAG